MRQQAFLILLLSCAIVACGRQVSPNPPGLGAGGAAPGFMTVKYDTVGAFDFSTYQYWVVFNTSGNGMTPLTNPQQSAWQAYSVGLEAANAPAGSALNPYEFLKPVNPGPPSFILLQPTPQQMQYILNSNGSASEYSVTIDRNVFLGVTTPAPSPTPLPHVWLFNGFVTQANIQNNLVFVDSMGSGGATDITYVSPMLDINTCFDETFYKQQDTNPPGNPSAQLVSVEIANNPSPGPNSSPCP